MQKKHLSLSCYQHWNTVLVRVNTLIKCNTSFPSSLSLSRRTLCMCLEKFQSTLPLYWVPEAPGGIFLHLFLYYSVIFRSNTFALSAHTTSITCTASCMGCACCCEVCSSMCCFLFSSCFWLANVSLHLEVILPPLGLVCAWHYLRALICCVMWQG